MEPSKFRESRQSINRLCEQMAQLIEKNAVDESKACFDQAHGQLDELRPQAAGDIQKRSVKNLALKLRGIEGKISKLKVRGSGSSGAGSRGKNKIEWDSERLAQLSKAFLEKILENLAGDPEATVCLGTTGKGIRPNYQIEFKDGRKVAYTGSGHKPKTGGGARNLSSPFSFKDIEEIVKQL